jgi:hypothetical protein
MVQSREKEKTAMQTTQAQATEAEILTRFVQPNRADFPPDFAQAFLKLDLDKKDRDRMHQLAVKNQEGTLTQAETEELDAYRRVAYFIDLMRSKARISLKEQGR